MFLYIVELVLVLVLSICVWVKIFFVDFLNVLKVFGVVDFVDYIDVFGKNFYGLLFFEL